MAFKNPAISPLTENQEKLLAQLGSIKNILSVPKKRNMSIPEDRQISTFDYLIRMAKATVGAELVDLMLKKFLDQVFDTQTDKLEKALLHGIAKSLDNQGKHISSNPQESNDTWLIRNALPPLNTSMQIVKALMVKQIISMIFGPKENMQHDISTAANNNIPIDLSNVPTQIEMLEIAVASDALFSPYNVGNQIGDQEYNLVTLKDRLEKGQVVFTISCQDVKISLPSNFNSEADTMVSSIVNLAGTTLPAGQNMPNPTILFEYINKHVGNEVQRINSQENKNAIRKSFLQILVEKVLNMTVIAVTPYLIDVFNRINTENPALNLSIAGLIGTPKVIKDLYKTDETQYNYLVVFTATVINALYALLLSIILKMLIKQIKKLIANAIAKRAINRKASMFKRLNAAKNLTSDIANTAEKASIAANALKEFNDIFNYGTNQNA